MDIKSNTRVKGIPSKETIWVKRTTEDGGVYYITSNDTRSMYYLYREDNGAAVKVGRGSKSPLELENAYI